MPTYEFRCPDGHEFEKFYRTISGAESESVCPVCGKTAVRFMSPAGFAFKGSGFYLTDYGKNAHRGEAPPKSGDSAGDSSSKESSSDSSKSDSPGGGESKSASSGSDTAKSADSSSSTAKPEKKAEPKAAESKPAKAPPKPSSGE
ncbi:MAG: FmdB family zinc ribbon protein [Gemmatimonadaceae bacterium]